MNRWIYTYHYASGVRYLFIYLFIYLLDSAFPTPSIFLSVGVRCLLFIYLFIYLFDYVFSKLFL